MRMQGPQRSSKSCSSLAFHMRSIYLRRKERSMQVLLPGKAAQPGSMQVLLPRKLAQVGRWAGPEMDRPGGTTSMTSCLCLHCAMAGIPGECPVTGPSHFPSAV